MKIGILTYHDGINYGCYFQAYAFQETIKSLGYDVKFINYKRFNFWFNEYKSLLKTKRLNLLVNNIKKIFVFNEAQKKLNTTSFTFSSKKVLDKEYDILIIGSDEVWNFIAPIIGFDPVYYGYNSKAKRKISYGSSMGFVPVDKEIPDQAKIGLKDFDFLSVRDDNTEKIIQKNLDISAVRVIDPTFLYNFSGLEKSIEDENFIIYYGLSIDQNYKDAIVKFAKDNNKKLISVGFFHPWCDSYIIDLDPFKWLSYFKNASHVITTMFHGTAFSIKYKKNFCSIKTDIRVNKISSLLNEFTLSNRLVSNPSEIKEVLANEIDYTQANSILTDKIYHSKEYLKKALQGE